MVKPVNDSRTSTVPYVRRQSWLYFAMLPFILLVFYALIEAIPTSSKETSVTSDESLLWGPYRPNLYFGMRPRVPESLLMGLMWSNADDLSPNSKY